ncbi:MULTISPECIES: LLM class flavin-dependent oxidoreductase [unclassified Nocardioides]|uniref:LLM class flavin-dependent oxidoreductase n=1 Tax=unclassified Nocardioides TaxID=2615069 RepID=UPI003620849E
MLAALQRLVVRHGVGACRGRWAERTGRGPVNPSIHALLIPDRDFSTLLSEVRWLEQIGVPTVWVDDHFAHPVDPRRSWLDAWSALAGWAATTERIGLGTLVSNPVLRSPAVLARQALSVEHISGGRLELGLGAGYAASDHDAAGVPSWSATERAARFASCVVTVDAVLRGDSARSADASELPVLAPRPTRTPRPPLTIAAHSAGSLALAARYGDRWISYGGFGLSAEEHRRVTAARLAGLEEACGRIGRDPATIRRALLIGSAATTPTPMWQSLDSARRLIDSYSAMGIDEFVLYYPPQAVWPAGAVQPEVFERLIEAYR